MPLAALSIMSSPVLAETARLVLTITDPIGPGDASHCVDGPPRASASLTVTEKDIASWDPDTKTWVLDRGRYSEKAGGARLADHCYELAIDGKPISKGLVLWMDSSRLTGFPTLIVTESDSALKLQLLSGNHGSYIRLIYGEDLNRVFREKPRPAVTKP